MHRIFRVKAYEKEHGPHFNEEYARKAVMKMENEDGTRGPHWSLEETTTLASQYGIALGSKFNRYDWFVALNMVYSDYYRVIMNITGSNLGSWIPVLLWKTSSQTEYHIWYTCTQNYWSSNYIYRSKI